MPEIHKSEVARFREQQALEEEAARLALSGLAITARHDFITARMQRGGERILQLIADGKHEEAQALMNSDNWSGEKAASKGKGRKRKSHA
ncbi:MAG TPA: hypothetical protein VJO32_05235 [Ktedonobacteraceae bacterium]|nr:hypothetical protein [Ktedonobacteraceae bacterium]